MPYSLRARFPGHFRQIVTGLLIAGAAALCALSTLGTGPVAAAPPGAPEPVAAVDLNRYLGTWYQLAAVPQPFNLVCARDTRAAYALYDNGDVRVRNTCTTWANTPNAINGRATVLDEQTGAQLRVRFPGVPGKGGPRDLPNYLIVGLDPDYRWAVVTNPARTSGFVLSRTPSLARGDWAAVRSAIAAAGQSDCLYLTSPTTGGYSEVVPLCTAGR
ncbi:hypothetical protein GOHSU_29_00300 [Gordonia hirsuta DSM 44140 = NBRC 16056]|uniref:Lipocalin/cytosolic fatty-acid binding domain-containing protein n=1 Tax=Gordonia hirsuta DSM 44140 = NBRC 16056 TaxID=1121927 RepID=L7LDB5_9ACTN|nr:lipocalin family protein [Gordonia hirsuta]GAC58047.1 hypothetical protein GOHSU_29_00300 [Gordonia hirsuta DSM 44140 = NBRC 16056]